ncbi:hypothetical protein BJQ94_06655 [Cryobacterium sp. SO2]|uniref:hypothetical protein n=1 Tax=Cryobacterium sp. SO2 TaxID=1897060 RepID=UPI00223D0637|nr:hypothetical protein [Cryobacterium sp. SO2]WEO78705.1 hypothetical protein BJQ94_06655 [Cryobacterium sp. SO2]
MEILLLIAGAILGVAGNFAFEFLRSRLERNSGGKVKIEGTWGEWTPKGYGRQFSVGEIKYRFWKRRYDFNGTNYYNDGRPYCHWYTTASYIDKERNEFHYIFANHDLSSPQVQLYGYGVIKLGAEGGGLVPLSGFYMYSGPRGARQMGHTMRQVKDPNEFADRSREAAAGLQRIFPVEWMLRSDSAPKRAGDLV